MKPALLSNFILYNWSVFLTDCLAIQERIPAPEHKVSVPFLWSRRYGCGPEASSAHTRLGSWNPTSGTQRRAVARAVALGFEPAPSSPDLWTVTSNDPQASALCLVLSWNNMQHVSTVYYYRKVGPFERNIQGKEISQLCEISFWLSYSLFYFKFQMYIVVCKRKPGDGGGPVHGLMMNIPCTQHRQWDTESSPPPPVLGCTWLTVISATPSHSPPACAPTLPRGRPMGQHTSLPFAPGSPGCPGRAGPSPRALSWVRGWN